MRIGNLGLLFVGLGAHGFETLKQLLLKFLESLLVQVRLLVPS
jgi:hypothetical protein